jgi:two-component system LytT family response regulator
MMNGVNMRTLLNALVVDDEPFARADLEELLTEYGGIRVAAEAGSVPEAIGILSGVETAAAPNPFDVVFLDIQLRGGDGFELLPHLPASVPVIFITAHTDYAIRAFEVNALDYLLKPVSPERLAQSIERLRTAQTGPLSGEPAAMPALGPADRVLVRTEGFRCFVTVSDICAISSVGGNYTELYTKSGERLLARTAIKEWEARLPGSEFVRIHRSVIVNKARIVKIQTNGGECLVQIQGHEQGFPASRRLGSSLRR